VHGDLATQRRQPLGKRAAEPTTRAGNEGDLTFQ
jgi:hypothetical protein